MKKLISPLVFYYLGFMSRLQIIKMRPTIIGVGGASGKTSLANFISLILKSKYKVLETKGKNSQTGIPLSILKINIKDYSFLDWLNALILAPLRVLFDWEKYDFLVAEMGIDGPLEPNNMGYLLKVIKPKIGVLTNISLEHSEYFDPLVNEKDYKKRQKKILQLTAKEEGLLLQSLPKDGLAVINLDDPEIRDIKDIKAPKITVSSFEKADLFIKKIELSLNSFSVNFVQNNDEYKIQVPYPLPRHFAYSFLLAIAVATKLGLSTDRAIESLEKDFSLPPGRMTIFEGKMGTTIIDSSYNNATILPILDLLDFLKVTGEKRRKVAIIGDMRELGSMRKINHEALAKKIAESADTAILIGPNLMQYASPILLKKNFDFYSFPNFTESKNKIKEIIKKRDVILVKGSQNSLFLERVVEELLKNPKDEERLARRGSFWDKRRKGTL